MLDYGFRSKCCGAPIRMGKKKIKKTNVSVSIWICCACNKRDVDLIDITKSKKALSTHDPFVEE